MPIKATSRFTAWSWSRLHDHEKCPLYAKLKYLDKAPEPEGDALVRGSAIHKLAQAFSTKQLKVLPNELKLYELEFKALRRRAGIETERQLALTAAWEPCDWFGRSAWVRAVLDCVYLDRTQLVVIDYKTGRVRVENNAQLDLYALVGFATYPAAETVSAEFWYLDQGETVVQGYQRSQVEELQWAWTKRAQPMLLDTKFKATPGEGCRWCAYGKSRGGTLCQF